MPLASLILAALAVSPAASHRAAMLARRSMREYDMGQLEPALADSQAAYLLDPRPALLFNLGQCHRALSHWALAEKLFRNYLRREPNAPNRAMVQKLIAEMVERQKPAARPASAVAAPASAASNGRARAASTSRERENAPSGRGPRDVTRETPSVERAGGSRLAATSPNVVHAAPAAAVTAASPRRSHALAWGLGATAVACAAVAVTGGLELSGWNAEVGGLSTERSYTQFTQDRSHVLAGRGGAQAWQAVAIAAGVAAAAAAVGMALTW